MQQWRRCDLNREEVIAAIEQVEVEDVSAQRDELIQLLKAWNSVQSVKWNNSWTRKILLAGCSCVFIVHLYLAHPARALSVGVELPGWVLYSSFFISLITIMWLYTRLQPNNDVDAVGMCRSCVKCKYDLTGLDSVLGDELWVGPAVCPECGQEYPAVGQ